MAEPLPARGDILRALLDASRPLHAREIATRCRVSEGSYPRLLELLDQLSLDGSVKRLAGNRFKAPREASQNGGAFDGILTVNPRGFGFVSSAGKEDVYVAADGIGGAMHGDRVRVRIVGRTNRGSEGRIEEVVKRRNPRVAGTLRRRGKSSWLEPDDSRVRGPIVVSDGAKLGKDGDAAVVSITRFPVLAGENPEGELVAVLGVPGDPNVEVAKILVREQIVEEHPDAAVREAEAMAARVQRLSFEGRVDLRQIPLPTIDPRDARDHDDAVWVEREANGYRAWIAIADVSEYVQPSSALDDEALARGCTIYLPDRAIPMLPAALSSDLCSLLAEQERLCLCVIAELDGNGVIRDFEIVEGVMRSCAMLTYSSVARTLGFTEEGSPSPAAEALKKGLRHIDELTRKLRRARLKRGALDLDLPEARVLLDERTGAPVDVARRAEDPGVKRAYQMIEELMIMANELVARWLSQRRSPAIYRVHAKPDETKLERLGEVARILGVEFDLAQMLEPRGLGRFLRRIENHPKRTVLEMLLLRSLKQAVYDIANVGHFGLASESYLHFTSPIRRYPDLEVHRAVKHMLRGGKPAVSAAAIEQLRAKATQSSTRERAAMEVEREVVDLYRTLFMRDRIGSVFEGTVTALVGSGLYITLDHPFVDVLMRFEAMGPDRYEATEDELGAVGLRSGDTISLGDRVVVTIDDVAVLRRTTYARRVPPEKMLEKLERENKRTRGRERGRGGDGGRVQEKPRRAVGRSGAGGRRRRS